ncbi:hypothetical protein Baya_11061 [Bagarius yarrelli]|uniref:Uncharacterized protein n=1 Tax=Bagarius yarrelli TaxID=175774 RepID=A0A556UZ16_BAGYA|nr:hypothetical protein Baya_11061 [Bagarius yarrelli]
MCQLTLLWEPEHADERDHRQRHVSGSRGSWIFKCAGSVVAPCLLSVRQHVCEPWQAQDSRDADRHSASIHTQNQTQTEKIY